MSDVGENRGSNSRGEGAGADSPGSGLAFRSPTKSRAMLGADCAVDGWLPSLVIPQTFSPPEAKSLFGTCREFEFKELSQMVNEGHENPASSPQLTAKKRKVTGSFF